MVAIYEDKLTNSQRLENIIANKIMDALMDNYPEVMLPIYESKEIVKTLMSLDKDVSYCEIKSPCGHDAFLLEYDVQSKIIKSFLNEHIKEETIEDK